MMCAVGAHDTLGKKNSQSMATIRDAQPQKPK
jgi:hypothetical protein